MSSKKLLLIILILLLVVSIPFGYSIYDNLFPKANPITCPKAEDVMSVSVTKDNSVVCTMEESEIEDLLQDIEDSEPTRHLALNESPRVENHYTIVIQATEREYHYYIYEDDNQVYLFSPYEGVYEVRPTILGLVSKEEDYEQ